VPREANRSVIDRKLRAFVEEHAAPENAPKLLKYPGALGRPAVHCSDDFPEQDVKAIAFAATEVASALAHHEQSIKPVMRSMIDSGQSSRGIQSLRDLI
jgi:hypothetical protein